MKLTPSLGEATPLRVRPAASRTVGVGTAFAWARAARVRLTRLLSHARGQSRPSPVKRKAASAQVASGARDLSSSYGRADPHAAMVAHLVFTQTRIGCLQIPGNAPAEAVVGARRSMALPPHTHPRQQDEAPLLLSSDSGSARWPRDINVVAALVDDRRWRRRGTHRCLWADPAT